MPGTYKTIELVGTSPVSFAEAVKAAVEEVAYTMRHMDWFEVVEQRGRIAQGPGIPGDDQDRLQNRAIAENKRPVNRQTAASPRAGTPGHS